MSSQIAILLHADERGGAERTVQTLAGTLAARGLDVDLVLMTGPTRPDLAPAGVRLVPLGTRRVATSVRPLARYLREERPVAMLSALTHANVAAIAAKGLSRSRARLILSEHTVVSRLKVASHRRRERIQPWLAARFYRHADGVVCVSDALADDLARVTGLPRAEIAVIPTPVDRAKVVRAAGAPVPHPWLADDESPVVMAVGRLERVKDFERLIRAIDIVREDSPARLVILGEGRERRRLEEEARARGLTADVLLPGFQDNPYAWMARADVFALSSVREALAMVLVEALALGRQVVSTDCRSGPREVLDNGKYGRLVPPGDERALAAAILAALADGERTVPSEVFESYDPERVADRYLELLLRQGARAAQGAAVGV